MNNEIKLIKRTKKKKTKIIIKQKIQKKKNKQAFKLFISTLGLKVFKINFYNKKSSSFERLIANIMYGI